MEKIISKKIMMWYMGAGGALWGVPGRERAQMGALWGGATWGVPGWRFCRRGTTNGRMRAAGRKQTAAPSGYAGFRRRSASIQNACPHKARAFGILNRFAAPSIPHAALSNRKKCPKGYKSLKAFKIIAIFPQTYHFSFAKRAEKL
ncbi:MAG: hypothetical protein MJ185_02965 [Treponema sp.]|nr:hypothetical protein [Treponema sp.]